MVLPIPEESYAGNPDSSIAVCTLSSMDLLKKLARSDVLNHVAIAGRLLSENKGIDSIINYVNKNPNISTIIVCGKEVWGHKAGHSLFELHKNGIDKNKRIIHSTSPDPYLSVPKSKINHFQKNIQLVNLINQDDLRLISDKIKSL